MRNSPTIQEASEDQETLYILRNPSLMEQVRRSLETHRQGRGYVPLPQEPESLGDSENA